MKTGNSCQKRAFLTLFGGMVIFCLCGFHSCNMEVDQEEILVAMVASAQQQKSDDCRYCFDGKSVELIRPLRFYPFFYSDVEIEEYVGYVLRYGRWEKINRNLLDGNDYLDLPVGSKVIISGFFVDVLKSRGEDGKESEIECYLLEITVPSRPEWDYKFIYLLGCNHKLATPFWDASGKLSNELEFKPVDIEKLYPGGIWFSAVKTE